MNAPARVTIGAGLGLVVACSSASDQGSTAARPEGSRDASVDAWYATVDGSGPGLDAGPIARPDSAGLDAGDAADSGDEAAVVPPACRFDGGMAPPGPGFCGDGWRQATAPDGGPGEECDDGLGDADTLRRSCSSQCEVLDELAVAQFGPDGGLANTPRTLGGGRHPIAASDGSLALVYIEPNANPLAVSMALFAPNGDAAGAIPAVSAPSTVVDGSDPVLVGLPCGKYAVAWADFDTQGGNDLDVAIRVVDPSSPPGKPLIHANTTVAFSQYAPDVAWTGSDLVVAWVDTSDPATQPDLRFRTFDTDLNPTSAEQTLAATPDSEADVALATFGGGWAAAWREGAGGLETVRVRAGAATWTIGPAFLPAPTAAKPALAALDGTHLLLVYAVGVDDADAGAASRSAVQAAVLDTSAPGTVTGVAIGPMSTGETGLDQSVPSAVSASGDVFVAWWTAGALGDPHGEEVWLKPVGWTNHALDLGSPEVPLQRWESARRADQRLPALAASALAPRGALLAAWDDLGRALEVGEGNGDVAAEVIPQALLRRSGDGGP